MRAVRHVWRGRLALAATVAIWSTPPVFQFWLAGPFEPWSQNFYRYLSGFLAMLPFLLWTAWRNPVRPSPREWAGCAVAAIPNIVHQVAQTAAVVLLWPGIYALLGRTSVIMTAVLVVCFVADERWIARSVKFQLGTALGLVGVAGLAGMPAIWPEGGRVLSLTGWWLALAAAAGWAAYAVLVKTSTARLGPTLGFGMISFFTALLLLPLMLAFGEPGSILRAGWRETGVLVASGVVSIGLGHWLYYIGIRDLGAAPAQSALLLCPLGTMALSAGLFGETFKAGQIAAGAVLLIGAFLALSARPPIVEEPA